MYSGHSSLVVGDHKCYIFDLLIWRVHNLDRTFVRVNFLMQEEEQRKSMAEMGRLLQAATTNNLSGKREESTENWFLFSSHSHTDTIQRICDVTE